MRISEWVFMVLNIIMAGVDVHYQSYGLAVVNALVAIASMFSIYREQL